MKPNAPSGIDFVHQPIPCPSRSGPKETGPIPGVNPGGSGAPVWVPIWSVTGWFSNVNVYLQAPPSWDDIQLRLYSLTAGTRHLVAQTTVATSGMEEVGGAGGPWRGIVLWARGQPGSGWAVEALNDSLDTTMPSAKISAELWGTESTPDQIGNRPGQTIRDHAMPSRAAHLLGWPAGGAGPWLPIAVDPVTAHLLVDTTVTVGVLSPAPVGDLALFANRGTLADAAVKAAPGRVFAVEANSTAGATRFLQLHDILGPIPALAVPRLSLRVPGMSTALYGNDFFGNLLPAPAVGLAGGIPFATGIRWGWSTTENVYTAAVAGTQTTQITYF
jgi:hypothetical protein